jgi:hypothetical protein
MAQPSQTPRWADQPGAEITEPNEGKKGAGWIAEAPPHNYFNWWMNRVYLWCVYLQNLVGEALTWTARQTFSGGATVVDPPVNPTDAASKSYVDAEATTRAEAVTAEATARAAADTAEAATRAAADTAEATARAAAVAAVDAKFPVQNSNLAADVAKANLGYTPVQQGTGVGQSPANEVKIGWSGSKLKATVDSSDRGNIAMESYVDSLTFPLSLQTMNPTNTGEFLGTITYWKDVCGIVHLEGRVQHIAGSSVSMVQLPLGFRPAADASFAVNVGNVTVMTDGWVSVSSLGILAWVLTPVAFRAA